MKGRLSSGCSVSYPIFYLLSDRIVHQSSDQRVSGCTPRSRRFVVPKLLGELASVNVFADTVAALLPEHTLVLLMITPDLGGEMHWFRGRCGVQDIITNLRKLLDQQHITDRQCGLAAMIQWVFTGRAYVSPSALVNF